MSLLWDAFWFFLPAGIANMSPVFAARLPWLRDLNTPIDFGKHIRGGRILGDSKTWRGVFFGAVIGGIVSTIQYKVFISSSESMIFVFTVGASMGFGALFGDAVESFFKRRLGHKPGTGWVPFDQIDYIIGGLLFVYPFKHLSLEFTLAIFVLYFILHLIFSYIGYWLKFKSQPI